MFQKSIGLYYPILKWTLTYINLHYKTYFKFTCKVCFCGSTVPCYNDSFFFCRVHGRFSAHLTLRIGVHNDYNLFFILKISIQLISKIVYFFTGLCSMYLEMQTLGILWLFKFSAWLISLSKSVSEYLLQRCWGRPSKCLAVYAFSLPFSTVVCLVSPS